MVEEGEERKERKENIGNTIRFLFHLVRPTLYLLKPRREKKKKERTYDQTKSLFGKIACKYHFPLFAKRKTRLLVASTMCSRFSFSAFFFFFFSCFR